jgi:hypothetical protein
MIQIGTITDIKAIASGDIPPELRPNYMAVGFFPSEILIKITATAVDADDESVQTEYEFRQFDTTSHPIEKYLGKSGNLLSDNTNPSVAEKFEAEFRIPADDPPGVTTRVPLPKLISVSSIGIVKPSSSSSSFGDPMIMTGSGIVMNTQDWITPEQVVSMSGIFSYQDDNSIYGLGRPEEPEVVEPAPILEVNNRKRKFKI